MLLQFKPMGSEDVQQLRLEAAEDKKVAALWLAAMHKVSREPAGLRLYVPLISPTTAGDVSFQKQLNVGRTPRLVFFKSQFDSS